MSTFKISKKNALSDNRTNIYDLHEKKLEKEYESEAKDLTDFIIKEKGWSQMTIRKRLRILQKIGLIEISKNPSDMWTNQINIKSD